MIDNKKSMADWKPWTFYMLLFSSKITRQIYRPERQHGHNPVRYGRE